MNTLTPFIRHEMDNLPGPAGKPGPSSSFNSPPLGRPPEAEPASPPRTASQTPQPGPGGAPTGAVPMTDGTPAPFRQKNAEYFLAGHTPGVMAFYQPENNVVDARGVPPERARPTQEDDETVLRLVEWREEHANS